MKRQSGQGQKPPKTLKKPPYKKLVLEKCMHVGFDPTKDEKDSLIAFLDENQDEFAWSAKDLQGVSRDIA